MTNHQPLAKILPKKETKEEGVEPILCSHCLRTANNGLKCKGICVADSDY